MGHYDECRDGNCSICGQADGYCEHTKKPVHSTTKQKVPLMFRGQVKSKIDPEHFGSGSVIVLSKEKWLVVHSNNFVYALNLRTFEMTDDGVEVEDVYFMSESEARELCDLCDNSCTYSDFTLNAEGVKTMPFKFAY